jgi:K+-sensing histidine kinase KdpD
MLNNARRWAPRGPWRYAVALVAALAAFGARGLMHPVLEAHMPALCFTIAAVLIGFFLGIGPAILVVAIGVPVADYFFVPPYANFGYFDKEDVILFVGFPAATLLFLGMIEWLRRTQHEAKLFAEVARSRHQMLLRSDKRRRNAEASHLISDRLLRQFTDESADVLYVGKVGSSYEYVSESLHQEIAPLEGESASARLMATFSESDASTFAAAFEQSGEQGTRSWPVRLPRRDPALSDLMCQLERFPTAHGAYLIMKIPSKAVG